LRVQAIVLAAGESRRMGRPKAALPFGASTLLGTVIETLSRTRVAGVTVVVGHHREVVERIAHSSGARVGVNPCPAEGMLSSVKAGIAATPEAEAWLIVLGDQPALDPGVVDLLIERARASERSILLPVHEGKRGHPLLIRAAWGPEILALPTDIGLNALVRAHPEAVEEVSTGSPGVLEDIDTPEDYRRATSAR
jgi:molybdenum cofactor cytidylyltransferase